MADEPPDTVRGYGMGAGIDVDLKTEQAQAAVSALTASIKEMEDALRDFGNKSYTMAETINRHLLKIGETATKVAGQLGQVTAAVSGAGQVQTTQSTATSPAATSAGTGSGWLQTAAQSATSAINRITQVGSGSKLTGGLSLGTFVGTQGESLTKDLVLAPLRYLRSRINTNRETALMASGGLSMVGMQQGSLEGRPGASTQDIMSTMGRFPGGVMGTPQDLIEMMASAPALGASYGFGGTPGAANARGQGVRAAGMFQGLRQMQQMNPMAQMGGEGGLMSTLGGYAGNTGAQQKAMMFTGGAMGMIAAGGRQKSLSEWAESILRWFEGLRPGNKRNKGFDYGELMAQYFPGSNIDAWFNVNQVPQNMRDYWWTYALAKANKVADTAAGGFTIGAEESNVAWNRLKASSELTRTEFSLAGTMAGQYSNRESANRWFNELMGTIQQQLFPLLTTGPFKLLGMMPDSIEDLLMTGAERGMSELMGDEPDIGDIGYGALGGTGLSGLHPDMKSKLGNMLKANPKIRINSGLRDTGLQKRLKDKGYNKVSGKPSAHTRGLAADLGPPSQYDWISRNAGKFGLSSGKRFGEPWHVGMGQIGDVDGIGDEFDEFLEAIKGVASGENLSDFITSLLTKVTGGLGKLFGGGDFSAGQGIDEKTGKPKAFKTEYDAGYYKTLMDATKRVQIGVPTYSGGAEGPGGTVGSVSPDLGGFNSPQDKVRAVNTAKAASAAGFAKNELVTMVAIAGSESSWNPLAHRSDKDKALMSGDRGLFQVNYTWDSTLAGLGIISSDTVEGRKDLFDPNVNARAAKYILDQQGLDAWSVYNSGAYQTNLGIAQEAVTAAGVGDAEYAMRLTQGGIPAGGRVIAFNNTFNLTMAPGGGGQGIGIDARRTAAVLADHLEAEMKTRLARAS